ncbi:MAG TPA: QsdR family transcriptional regulator [Thermoleophilaceae bacterium]
MAAPIALVPEGLERPLAIPPEIFEAALDTFLQERRLDMGALACGLGISRATLHRRAGGRDHLLGQVMWFLTRVAMVRALLDAGHLTGRERVLAAVDGFMRSMEGRPALQRLLDTEPETALRILTSRHGPIQGGIIESLERLIRQEIDSGHLATAIEPHTLAYVIVRVGESFLYADTIGSGEPDVDQAAEVIAHLV